MVRLRPDNLSVELKICLIHVTYQTPQFSLVYLKRAQSTCIGLQLGKMIYHQAN